MDLEFASFTLVLAKLTIPAPRRGKNPADIGRRSRPRRLAQRYVEEHYFEDLSLTSVAEAFRVDRAYVEAASRKSDLERTDLAKDKSAVFTGAFAIIPVDGNRIPI